MLLKSVITAALSGLSLIAVVSAAPTGEQVQRQLNFRFPSSTSPKRFDIQVDKKFLKYTERKVQDYRPSPNVVEDWSLEGPAP